MKKIKKMGYELVESWLKLITSDITGVYIDKGFGFTVGSLTAIAAWIACMWTLIKIISIIIFPFKLIKKLLKK